MRAHRIGSFKNGSKRPILAKITNDKEIDSLLSNEYKFRNTNFSVSRDYSASVTVKQRNLLQYSKSFNKEGDKINLRFLTNYTLTIRFFHGTLAAREHFSLAEGHKRVVTDTILIVLLTEISQQLTVQTRRCFFSYPSCVAPCQDCCN